ncbi:hypothetical protein K438DRAFT_1994071 [Mycena galopus ATCC 62051]|nr:hypothetical protein K438DRAFT_1994071 [Mycena galopus ATCC 62051]
MSSTPRFTLDSASQALYRPTALQHPSNLRGLIETGKVVISTSLSYPSRHVAKTVAVTGADMCWLDAEHVAWSPKLLVECIQIIHESGGKMIPVAWCLDAGAGVRYPYVLFRLTMKNDGQSLKDLGICADLILQGIIFTQIAHYTTLYEKDALALRAFVAVLLIITTLKSVHGLVILWIQNVEYFMNLNAALSMSTDSWPTEASSGEFICAKPNPNTDPIQVISKNIYIVGLVVGLFVFALVAAIVSSVLTFTGQVKNITWIEIHMGTVFVGDVLLCGSTIYFLSYHSKHASPETAGMLNSITKLTFQSAAPAVVCALITLVGTVAWNRTTPNAYVMLAIIANNVLPKLYAISAMWTLNCRRSIRQAHSDTGRSSTTAQSRPRDTTAIELSSLWLSSDWITESSV